MIVEDIHQRGGEAQGGGSHSVQHLLRVNSIQNPLILFSKYTALVVAVSAGSSPLIGSGTESMSIQLGLLAGEAVFFVVT